MYAEAYVDSGEGWRWRFHVTDAAGLLGIESQAWDEKERVWKSEGPAEHLHVQAIPQIIADAI
jgi:hypothetical protein